MFGREGWLYALLALPLMAGLFASAFWRQRSAARLFAGSALGPLLTRSVSWGRRRAKAALVIVGAVAPSIATPRSSH